MSYVEDVHLYGLSPRGQYSVKSTYEGFLLEDLDRDGNGTLIPNSPYIIYLLEHGDGEVCSHTLM
jgi:hypothetical protein